MTRVVTWVLANPDAAAALAVGALSLLSGAFEAAGMTRTSKVLGTVSVDLGRVVRKLRGQP